MQALDWKGIDHGAPFSGSGSVDLSELVADGGMGFALFSLFSLTDPEAEGAYQIPGYMQVWLEWHDSTGGTVASTQCTIPLGPGQTFPLQSFVFRKVPHAVGEQDFVLRWQRVDDSFAPIEEDPGGTFSVDLRIV
jgi:hypothetical protein